MPEIPPWVGQAADPASHFLQAWQAGAAIAQRNRALDIQSASESARMEMERQHAMREEAQLAVENARSNIELSMKKSELDLQQKEFQMKASAMARKALAQRQFQSLIDSGVDPVTASFKSGLAGESTTLTGLAQAMKLAEKKPDISETFPAPAPGTMSHFRRGGKDVWMKGSALPAPIEAPKWTPMPGNPNVLTAFNPRTGVPYAHNVPKESAQEELLKAAGQTDQSGVAPTLNWSPKPGSVKLVQ